MKCLVLSGLLAVAISSSASAQIEALFVIGNAILTVPRWSQNDQKYVGVASYKQYTFARKRSPADRYTGKGGSQIRTIEQVLDGYEATMRTDSTALIVPPEQEATYPVARAALGDALPTWSLLGYDKEMAFYLSLNEYRQKMRQRLMEKFLQQARAEAARDSLRQVQTTAAPKRK